MKQLAVAFALLAGVLVGCTSPIEGALPGPAPDPAAAVGEPAALTIPSLELAAVVDRTGLADNGSITVPDVNKPDIAAWVDAGPKPGDTGRALIIGHINGAGKPGVFADLATITPGSEVRVTDSAGAEVRFVVDAITQWPKDQFPTGRVYGDTNRAELALVTCGGEFDPAAGSHPDNIIVLAHRA